MIVQNRVATTVGLAIFLLVLGFRIPSTDASHGGGYRKTISGGGFDHEKTCHCVETPFGYCSPWIPCPEGQTLERCQQSLWDFFGTSCTRIIVDGEAIPYEFDSCDCNYVPPDADFPCDETDDDCFETLSECKMEVCCNDAGTEDSVCAEFRFCEEAYCPNEAVCSDLVEGWYDSEGLPFDCSWYTFDDRCREFGYGFENFGYTAREACCACGGGGTIVVPRTASPTPPIAENPETYTPTALEPTVEPSPSPSYAPTMLPTHHPTEIPTSFPTIQPSIAPTHSPGKNNKRICKKQDAVEACKADLLGNKKGQLDEEILQQILDCVPDPLIGGAAQIIMPCIHGLDIPKERVNPSSAGDLIACLAEFCTVPNGRSNDTPKGIRG